MKVTEELKKQVKENEVIVSNENVELVDDGEESENYEYGEEEIEYEEGEGGEVARGDHSDDDSDDDTEDYVDDTDDEDDDFVDDTEDDDDDFEDDDDDYDDEDEDEDEEEEVEQEPAQQQQPQPQPEQQARVPPVYDQFMLNCLNFVQDICNTLQMPIPSYFNQSSDIWAAAQHHREMHPPQLYQQFDGNWERFQQFQQEQLTKFHERQLQMRQLFIQQYQVAVEQQQQFPAAPQQQHDELSDNMFEAVVDDQQHHQDQD